MHFKVRRDHEKKFPQRKRIGRRLDHITYYISKIERKPISCGKGLKNYSQCKTAADFFSRLKKNGSKPYLYARYHSSEGTALQI